MIIIEEREGRLVFGRQRSNISSNPRAGAMRIAQVIPKENGLLHIVAEDGRNGVFDVRPYLNSEAFRPLHDWHEFSCIINGSYFIGWKCGADLSADTIEARWQIYAA